MSTAREIQQQLMVLGQPNRMPPQRQASRAQTSGYQVMQAPVYGMPPAPLVFPSMVNFVPEEAPLSKDHGSIRESKSLYRSKPDSRGVTTWTANIPEDVEEVAENEETAKYALIVRYDKSSDGRRKFTIDSIVVQSPVLKEMLGEVFKAYSGITTSLRRLEFHTPLHPFVHRWTQFRDMRDKLVSSVEQHPEDIEARGKSECMNLLFTTLREELQDIVDTRDDLVRQSVITYDLLWSIFESDSIVIHENNAFKVTTASETQNGFMIQGQTVDWNGSYFGYATKGMIIGPFSGTRPIQELGTYPLRFHPDVAGIKRTLLERAAKWESLCGVHYKQYDGVAQMQTPLGQSKVTVHSRIVIDTVSWNDFNPNSVVSLAPTAPVKASSMIDGSANEPTSPGGRLSEGDMLIATSMLKGYSCKDKQWIQFPIENISDVIWDEDAFAKLVLPDNHKTLVRAVAESQAQFGSCFDDLIRGKGQGMIILLNGPPGVGKTLTAESVAEVMKVPVYYMSSVDLGSRASDVENALSKVFKMVTKWDAVLLLDEADVFLEKRTNRDLERNKLVSGLEELLSSMSFAHDFSDTDLDALAGRDLNGRQIKNLLKTAVLMAARKSEPLRKSHVDFVLSIDPQTQMAVPIST